MPYYVTLDAARVARRVPYLYDFLLAEHPNEVIQEGDSLRLVCNHSVSIKRGYSGYTDFATGETGNPIDCLMNYFGYDFQCAVAVLCELVGVPADLQPQSIDLRALQSPGHATASLGTVVGTPASPPAVGQGITPPNTVGCLQDPPGTPQKPFAPPAALQGPYRQLFAYLMQQRGIPAELVQRLVDGGLLYQEAGHNNMVFIDPSRTYAELRGTVPGKPFHGMVSGSDATGFWWFKPGAPGSIVTGAFICEAAIDAISLHLLRQRFPLPPGDNPMYCSIGGVANKRRIDTIKAVMSAAGKPVVLAVDNDDAGERCRQNNPDCYALVPQLKDWNADWLETQKAG